MYYEKIKVNTKMIRNDDEKKEIIKKDNKKVQKKTKVDNQ